MDKTTHDPRRIEELIEIVLNHEDYRSDFDMQGLAVFTKELIHAVRGYFVAEKLAIRDARNDKMIDGFTKQRAYLRALVPDKEEG